MFPGIRSVQAQQPTGSIPTVTGTPEGATVKVFEIIIAVEGAKGIVEASRKDFEKRFLEMNHW